VKRKTKAMVVPFPDTLENLRRLQRQGLTVVAGQTDKAAALARAVAQRVRRGEVGRADTAEWIESFAQHLAGDGEALRYALDMLDEDEADPPSLSAS
jgi:hypothetical protein